LNFFLKFPKNFTPRKVLHVYAIYQKYTIIAFNPPNFPKNLFPWKVFVKLGGSVHAIYQKCRIIIFNFPPVFQKTFPFPSRKVLHVWNISKMP